MRAERGTGAAVTGWARRTLFLILAAGYAWPAPFSASAAEKRPHALKMPRIEVGIGYAHRPGSMTQAPAISVPVRVESYFSDAVDLVFDGWAGYSRHTGDDAFGVLVAPGFAYWIDASTKIEPHARLGYEYFHERNDSVLVIGADALAERWIGLHPERAYPRQDYLVPGVKIGAVSRLRDKGDYSYAFAGLALSYERGLGALGGDLHLRTKMTVESELQANGDGDLAGYHSAFVSLRMVKADGRLVAKGEIGVTSDFDDYTKVGVTLSRGF